MIADLVAHIERLGGGEHLALPHREPVGRVIGQRVAARLGLQKQREGRIAADVDPLDRVHLDGDVEAHRVRSAGLGLIAKRRGVPGAVPPPSQR